MTFAEAIVSPDYCVDNRGETVYRGDDNCPLRWSDARA
jgi:mannose-1-phosphate guanylyltransferase